MCARTGEGLVETATTRVALKKREVRALYISHSLKWNIDGANGRIKIAASEVTAKKGYLFPLYAL